MDSTCGSLKKKKRCAGGEDNDKTWLCTPASIRESQLITAQDNAVPMLALFYATLMLAIKRSHYSFPVS